jgi:hypothetical protein
VSQSHSGEFGDHDALDPLAAFNAELAAADSPQKPVDPPPSAAAPTTDGPVPLRLRLAQAQRSLDHAQGEIAELQLNVATLVSAVEEINKRLSRRPEVVPAPPPVPKPLRVDLLKIAVLPIICLAIGAALWALASGMIDSPEPVTSAEASLAPPIPSPAAADTTPAVELQTVVANVAPPAVDSARQTARVAQDKPTPVPVERRARQGAYVGTLSIDAAPAGEVWIDRQAAGRTPLRAENLRAGSHLIWIEREGYRRWTRVVAVTADRVTRVSAKLEPMAR